MFLIAHKNQFVLSTTDVTSKIVKTRENFVDFNCMW